MNRPLRIAKQFYRDVDTALVYLDEHANESVVARFAAAVASTRTHIRTFPESGNLHYSAVIETVELRMFPVTKFPYYLVFYIAGPDEVVLVRLLHGMRDLSTELEALDTSE